MIRIFSMAGVAALLAGMAPQGDPSPAFSPASSAVPAAPAAAPQEDFHWSGRLAQGEQIQVNNIVGDIRAEPADGGEVTVTGVRSGGSDVRVEVVRRREGVVICAVYPEETRRGGWRDDEDDGGDGVRDACNRHNMHVGEDSGRIRFTVRVPAGVKLVAHTVTGDVQADRLRGPVDAKSVSGSVRVSSAGPVEAASVSGDVFAAMGRMPQHDVAFRSVSGTVTVEVPSGIDADFHAQTLSGTIDSDFPVERPRENGWVRVGHQAHATLGRGGPSLSVTTVSGNVVLRRGR